MEFKYKLGDIFVDPTYPDIPMILTEENFEVVGSYDMLESLIASGHLIKLSDAEAFIFKLKHSEKFGG